MTTKVKLSFFQRIQYFFPVAFIIWLAKISWKPFSRFLINCVLFIAGQIMIWSMHQLGVIQLDVIGFTNPGFEFVITGYWAAIIFIGGLLGLIHNWINQKTLIHLLSFMVKFDLGSYYVYAVAIYGWLVVTTLLLIGQATVLLTVSSGFWFMLSTLVYVIVLMSLDILRNKITEVS